MQPSLVEHNLSKSLHRCLPRAHRWGRVTKGWPLVVQDFTSPYTSLCHFESPFNQPSRKHSSYISLLKAINLEVLHLQHLASCRLKSKASASICWASCFKLQPKKYDQGQINAQCIHMVKLLNQDQTHFKTSKTPHPNFTPRPEVTCCTPESPERMPPCDTPVPHSPTCKSWDSDGQRSIQMSCRCGLMIMIYPVWLFDTYLYIGHSKKILICI